MKISKTHFATVERATESHNYDEWSRTICGLEEEFKPLKLSDNIKFVNCKKCLKSYPKFLESQNQEIKPY